MISNNPILNSPYLEPKLHYDTDSEGNLDYNNIVEGRRIFKPDASVIPTRQTGQKEVFEWNDDDAEYGTHIIKLCRKEVEKWIRPVFNYYNKFSSTKYVNGNTIKEVYPTKRSHVNYVVMDSDWEAIAAKTLEEFNVESYVKNQFLGFTVPYAMDGKDRQYYPDFIARVKGKDGKVKNLIIEISGMSKDKEEKKWFVENRWLPAVNALKDKYEYPEWHFIEVANDIRNIKNQLIEKIQSI